MAVLTKKPRIMNFAWLLLLAPILFGGIDSYMDLDNLIFVTSILVDCDEENGNTVVYFETFKPVRSSQEKANTEKRIVYKAEGIDMIEAARRLKVMTSSEVMFTHNKVILFTERASERGLKIYFDFFDRNQEMVNRTYLCVYEGDVKDYIETNIDEEHMTGLFLYDLINNCDSITPAGTRINIHDFLSNRYLGSHINTMPVVSVKAQKEVDKQYGVFGIAIFNEYKMTGKLEDHKPFYYNLLNDKTARGLITIPNPQEPGGVCTLRSKSSKLSTKLFFEGDLPVVERTIALQAILGETTSDLSFSGENLFKMEKEAEKRIVEECMQLYDLAKEKKEDIFNFQLLLERSYPELSSVKIIDRMELRLHVMVDIVETTTVENFS